MALASVRRLKTWCCLAVVLQEGQVSGDAAGTTSVSVEVGRKLQDVNVSWHLTVIIFIVRSREEVLTLLYCAAATRERGRYKHP